MILEQWLLSVQQIVNNTAYLWGGADYGELGLNSTTRQANPTAIGGYWKKIALGKDHTLAIDNNGFLYAWGRNNFGQLGNGDTAGISRSSPVQIGNSKWIDISTKVDTSVGIRSDGLMFSWGMNLGSTLDSTLTDYVFSPNLLGRPLEPNPVKTSYTSIAAAGINEVSDGHLVALRSDGALFTWGLNSSGQLGHTDTIGKSSPVQVGTSSWTFVSAGGDRTIAIKTDGTLWAWGQGGLGNLGQNDRISKSSPVQIGTSSWIYVSAGSISTGTGAIRSDGALFMWGQGTNGQHGTNDTFNRSSPVQVGTSSWTMVATGGSTTLAIKIDGTLWSWGWGGEGQLGNNQSLSQRSSPVQVGTSSWTFVSNFGTAVGAIRSDGALFMWGRNSFGEHGQNDTIARSSPVQVGTSSWSVVYARSAVVAIRSDGALFAWGDGSRGRTGLNSTEDKSSPVQVGTSSWKLITNDATVAGITQDDDLYLWGANQFKTIDTISSITRISPTIFGSPYSVSPVQIGNSSWKAVSAGTNHFLAINSSNLLFSWGVNRQGQLGISDINATFYEKNVPTIIGQEFSWSLVAGGTFFTSAIRSDGALFMWGQGTNGQLGNNDTNARSSPVQIGTSSWSKVFSGNNSVLAVRSDSALFSWGLNTAGNLGTNDTISRSSPVQIGTSSWTLVTVSSYAGPSGTATNAAISGAIRSDGALFIWGAGAFGQLGQNDTISRSSPVQVGTSSWISVSAGGLHTAAIRTDGGLFVWGNSQSNVGRLGIPDGVDRSSPVQLGTSSWSVVSAAHASTHAIRSDGALFAWGFNTNAQLGTDDTISRSSPVQIGTSSWTAVSSGNANTIAIRSDGILFAWGFNANNGGADNTTVDRSSPVQIGTNSWYSVSAFGANVGGAAIRNDFTLFAYGRNTTVALGQIGDGSAGAGTSKFSPVIIGSIPRYSWNSISAGNEFSSAIRTDGALFSWGENNYGQLGQSAFSTNFNTSPRLFYPERVGNTFWKSVSSGNYHTLAISKDNYLYGYGDGVFQDSLPTNISWTYVASGSENSAAIRSDGALFVWGRNLNGTLGLGDTRGRSSPVQLGTSSWTSVAISTSHVLAIRSDGALFTWGAGATGRLGTNDGISRSSPVQIGTSSWIMVAGGTSSSVAIRADGALFTWGGGIFGQLGQINNIAKSSPVQVGTSSWISVSAGQLIVAAIRSDGALFTWGRNNTGQLGINDSIDRSSPVQIGTSSWTSAFATSGVSIALRFDGALFTWGANPNGELGQNDNIARSSPVQVGTSSWTNVYAGGGHAAAIRTDGALFMWGQGSNGRLGFNDIISRSSPVQFGTYSWSMLSTRTESDHTLAIRNDGALIVWGNGGVARLGLNIDRANRSSPVQVYSAGIENKSSPVQIGSSTWKSVQAGAKYNAAINSGDILYVWGFGDSTELNTITTPTSVLSGVSSMDVNEHSAGALKY